MSLIDTLLESEDGKKYVEAHGELLQEADAALEDFRKVMKAFVLANTTEFLGETLDETKKNIKVFSEVATSQFITEITSICGQMTADQNVVAEQSINDYL